ncbi:MAG: hypothetical protein DLM61_06610 [Pseudonocardiales bacterium]|nr:MAG: hypothetical protein DLM61_06610 [Pseudonocardiales bacterium]
MGVVETATEPGDHLDWRDGTTVSRKGFPLPGPGQLPALAHAAVALLDAAAGDLAGVVEKCRVGLGEDAPDHRIKQLNRAAEHRHPIRPRHRPLVTARHKIPQMPHQVLFAHHPRMTHSAGSAGLFVPRLPR